MGAGPHIAVPIPKKSVTKFKTIERCIDCSDFVKGKHTDGGCARRWQWFGTGLQEDFLWEGCPLDDFTKKEEEEPLTEERRQVLARMLSVLPPAMKGADGVPLCSHCQAVGQANCPYHGSDKNQKEDSDARD